MVLPRLLLLSADEAILNDFEALSAEMSFRLSRSDVPTAAMRLLEAENYDGVFVDCDDLHGAKAVIPFVKTTPANRSTPVIAILNDETAPADAKDQGAAGVLTKPLSPERLQLAIKEACARFRDRQHERVSVAIAVYLSFGEVFDRLATTLNISEGGLAVRCDAPIDMHEAVRVKFQLQESGLTINARGEVAWTDARGYSGIRFVSFTPPESSAQLKKWIDARRLKRRTQREGRLLGTALL